jgi:hypothetical protein
MGEILDVEHLGHFHQVDENGDVHEHRCGSEDQGLGFLAHGHRALLKAFEGVLHTLLGAGMQSGKRIGLVKTLVLVCICARLGAWGAMGRRWWLYHGGLLSSGQYGFFEYVCMGRLPERRRADTRNSQNSNPNNFASLGWVECLKL